MQTGNGKYSVPAAASSSMHNHGQPIKRSPSSRPERPPVLLAVKVCPPPIGSGSSSCIATFPPPRGKVVQILVHYCVQRSATVSPATDKMMETLAAVNSVRTGTTDGSADIWPPTAVPGSPNYSPPIEGSVNGTNDAAARSLDASSAYAASIVSTMLTNTKRKAAQKIVPEATVSVTDLLFEGWDEILEEWHVTAVASPKLSQASTTGGTSKAHPINVPKKVYHSNIQSQVWTWLGSSPSEGSEWQLLGCQRLVLCSLSAPTSDLPVFSIGSHRAATTAQPDTTPTTKQQRTGDSVDCPDNFLHPSIHSRTTFRILYACRRIRFVKYIPVDVSLDIQERPHAAAMGHEISTKNGIAQGPPRHSQGHSQTANPAHTGVNVDGDGVAISSASSEYLSNAAPSTTLAGNTGPRGNDTSRTLVAVKEVTYDPTGAHLWRGAISRAPNGPLTPLHPTETLSESIALISTRQDIANINTNIIAEGSSSSSPVAPTHVDTKRKPRDDKRSPAAPTLQPIPDKSQFPAPPPPTPARQKRCVAIVTADSSLGLYYSYSSAELNRNPSPAHYDAAAPNELAEEDDHVSLVSFMESASTENNTVPPRLSRRLRSIVANCKQDLQTDANRRGPLSSLDAMDAVERCLKDHVHHSVGELLDQGCDSALVPFYTAVLSGSSRYASSQHQVPDPRATPFFSPFSQRKSGHAKPEESDFLLLSDLFGPRSVAPELTSATTADRRKTTFVNEDGDDLQHVVADGIRSSSRTLRNGSESGSAATERYSGSTADSVFTSKVPTSNKKRKGLFGCCSAADADDGGGRQFNNRLHPGATTINDPEAISLCRKLTVEVESSLGMFVPDASESPSPLPSQVTESGFASAFRFGMGFAAPFASPTSEDVALLFHMLKNAERNFQHRSAIIFAAFNPPKRDVVMKSLNPQDAPQFALSADDEKMVSDVVSKACVSVQKIISKFEAHIAPVTAAMPVFDSPTRTNHEHPSTGTKQRLVSRRAFTAWIEEQLLCSDCSLSNAIVASIDDGDGAHFASSGPHKCGDSEHCSSGIVGAVVAPSSHTTLSDASRGVSAATVAKPPRNKYLPPKSHQIPLKSKPSGKGGFFSRLFTSDGGNGDVVEGARKALTENGVDAVLLFTVHQNPHLRTNMVALSIPNPPRTPPVVLDVEVGSIDDERTIHLGNTETLSKYDLCSAFLAPACALLTNLLVSNKAASILSANGANPIHSGVAKVRHSGKKSAATSATTAGDEVGYLWSELFPVLRPIQVRKCLSRIDSNQGFLVFLPACLPGAISNSSLRSSGRDEIEAGFSGGRASQVELLQSATTKSNRISRHNQPDEEESNEEDAAAPKSPLILSRFSSLDDDALDTNPTGDNNPSFDVPASEHGARMPVVAVATHPSAPFVMTISSYTSSPSPSGFDNNSLSEGARATSLPLSAQFSLSIFAVITRGVPIPYNVIGFGEEDWWPSTVTPTTSPQARAGGPKRGKKNSSPAFPLDASLPFDQTIRGFLHERQTERAWSTVTGTAYEGLRSDASTSSFSVPFGHLIRHRLWSSRLDPREPNAPPSTSAFGPEPVGHHRRATTPTSAKGGATTATAASGYFISAKFIPTAVSVTSLSITSMDFLGEDAKDRAPLIHCQNLLIALCTSIGVSVIDASIPGMPVELHFVPIPGPAVGLVTSMDLTTSSLSPLSTTASKANPNSGIALPTMSAWAGVGSPAPATRQSPDVCFLPQEIVACHVTKWGEGSCTVGSANLRKALSRVSQIDKLDDERRLWICVRGVHVCASTELASGDICGDFYRGGTVACEQWVPYTFKVHSGSRHWLVEDALCGRVEAMIAPAPFSSGHHPRPESSLSSIPDDTAARKQHRRNIHVGSTAKNGDEKRNARRLVVNRLSLYRCAACPIHSHLVGACRLSSLPSSVGCRKLVSTDIKSIASAFFIINSPYTRLMGRNPEFLAASPCVSFHLQSIIADATETDATTVNFTAVVTVVVRFFQLIVGGDRVGSSFDVEHSTTQGPRGTGEEVHSDGDDQDVAHTSVDGRVAEGGSPMAILHRAAAKKAAEAAQRSSSNKEGGVPPTYAAPRVIAPPPVRIPRYRLHETKQVSVMVPLVRSELQITEDVSPVTLSPQQKQRQLLTGKNSKGPDLNFNRMLSTFDPRLIAGIDAVSLTETLSGVSTGGDFTSSGSGPRLARKRSSASPLQRKGTQAQIGGGKSPSSLRRGTEAWGGSHPLLPPPRTRTPASPGPPIRLKRVSTTYSLGQQSTPHSSPTISPTCVDGLAEAAKPRSLSVRFTVPQRSRQWQSPDRRESLWMNKRNRASPSSARTGPSARRDDGNSSNNNSLSDTASARDGSLSDSWEQLPPENASTSSSPKFSTTETNQEDPHANKPRIRAWDGFDGQNPLDYDTVPVDRSLITLSAQVTTLPVHPQLLCDDESDTKVARHGSCCPHAEATGCELRTHSVVTHLRKDVFLALIIGSYGRDLRLHAGSEPKRLFGKGSGGGAHLAQGMDEFGIEFNARRKKRATERTSRTIDRMSMSLSGESNSSVSEDLPPGLEQPMIFTPNETHIHPGAFPEDIIVLMARHVDPTTQETVLSDVGSPNVFAFEWRVLLGVMVRELKVQCENVFAGRSFFESAPRVEVKEDESVPNPGSPRSRSKGAQKLASFQVDSAMLYGVNAPGKRFTSLLCLGYPLTTDSVLCSPWIELTTTPAATHFSAFGTPANHPQPAAISTIVGSGDQGFLWCSAIAMAAPSLEVHSPSHRHDMSLGTMVEALQSISSKDVSVINASTSAPHAAPLKTPAISHSRVSSSTSVKPPGSLNLRQTSSVNQGTGISPLLLPSPSAMIHFRILLPRDMFAAVAGVICTSLADAANRADADEVNAKSSVEVDLSALVEWSVAVPTVEDAVAVALGTISNSGTALGASGRLGNLQLGRSHSDSVDAETPREKTSPTRTHGSTKPALDSIKNDNSNHDTADPSLLQASRSRSNSDRSDGSFGGANAPGANPRSASIRVADLTYKTDASNTSVNINIFAQRSVYTAEQRDATARGTEGSPLHPSDSSCNRQHRGPLEVPQFPQQQRPLPETGSISMAVVVLQALADDGQQFIRTMCSIVEGDESAFLPCLSWVRTPTPNWTQQPYGGNAVTSPPAMRKLNLHPTSSVPHAAAGAPNEAPDPFANASATFPSLLDFNTPTGGGGGIHKGFLPAPVALDPAGVAILHDANMKSVTFMHDSDKNSSNNNSGYFSKNDGGWGGVSSQSIRRRKSASTMATGPRRDSYVRPAKWTLYNKRLFTFLGVPVNVGSPSAAALSHLRVVRVSNALSVQPTGVPSIRIATTGTVANIRARRMAEDDMRKGIGKYAPKALHLPLPSEDNREHHENSSEDNNAPDPMLSRSHTQVANDGEEESSSPPASPRGGGDTRGNSLSNPEELLGMMEEIKPPSPKQLSGAVGRTPSSVPSPFAPSRGSSVAGVGLTRRQRNVSIVQISAEAPHDDRDATGEHEIDSLMEQLGDADGFGSDIFKSAGSPVMSALTVSTHEVMDNENTPTLSGGAAVARSSLLARRSTSHFLTLTPSAKSDREGAHQADSANRSPISPARQPTPFANAALPSPSGGVTNANSSGLWENETGVAAVEVRTRLSYEDAGMLREARNVAPLFVVEWEWCLATRDYDAEVTEQGYLPPSAPLSRSASIHACVSNRHRSLDVISANESIPLTLFVGSDLVTLMGAETVFNRSRGHTVTRSAKERLVVGDVVGSVFEGSLAPQQQTFGEARCVNFGAISYPGYALFDGSSSVVTFPFVQAIAPEVDTSDDEMYEGYDDRAQKRCSIGVTCAFIAPFTQVHSSRFGPSMIPAAMSASQFSRANSGVSAGSPLISVQRSSSSTKPLLAHFGIVAVSRGFSHDVGGGSRCPTLLLTGCKTRVDVSCDEDGIGIEGQWCGVFSGCGPSGARHGFVAYAPLKGSSSAPYHETRVSFEHESLDVLINTGQYDEVDSANFDVGSVVKVLVSVQPTFDSAMLCVPVAQTGDSKLLPMRGEGRSGGEPTVTDIVATSATPIRLAALEDIPTKKSKHRSPLQRPNNPQTYTLQPPCSTGLPLVLETPTTSFAEVDGGGQLHLPSVLTPVFEIAAGVGSNDTFLIQRIQQQAFQCSMLMNALTSRGNESAFASAEDAFERLFGACGAGLGLLRHRAEQIVSVFFATASLQLSLQESLYALECAVSHRQKHEHRLGASSMHVDSLQHLQRYVGGIDCALFNAQLSSASAANIGSRPTPVGDVCLYPVERAQAAIMDGYSQKAGIRRFFSRHHVLPKGLLLGAPYSPGYVKQCHTIAVARKALLVGAEQHAAGLLVLPPVPTFGAPDAVRANSSHLPSIPSFPMVVSPTNVSQHLGRELSKSNTLSLLSQTQLFAVSLFGSLREVSNAVWHGESVGGEGAALQALRRLLVPVVNVSSGTPCHSISTSVQALLRVHARVHEIQINHIRTHIEVLELSKSVMRQTLSTSSHRVKTAPQTQLTQHQQRQPFGIFSFDLLDANLVMAHALGAAFSSRCRSTQSLFCISMTLTGPVFSILNVALQHADKDSTSTTEDINNAFRLLSSHDCQEPSETIASATGSANSHVPLPRKSIRAFTEPSFMASELSHLVRAARGIMELYDILSLNVVRQLQVVLHGLEAGISEILSPVLVANEHEKTQLLQAVLGKDAASSTSAFNFVFACDAFDDANVERLVSMLEATVKHAVEKSTHLDSVYRRLLFIKASGQEALLSVVAHILLAAPLTASPYFESELLPANNHIRSNAFPPTASDAAERNLIDLAFAGLKRGQGTESNRHKPSPLSRCDRDVACDHLTVAVHGTLEVLRSLGEMEIRRKETLATTAAAIDSICMNMATRVRAAIHRRRDHTGVVPNSQGLLQAVDSISSFGGAASASSPKLDPSAAATPKGPSLWTTSADAAKAPLPLKAGFQRDSWPVMPTLPVVAAAILAEVSERCQTAAASDATSSSPSLISVGLSHRLASNLFRILQVTQTVAKAAPTQNPANQQRGADVKALQLPAELVPVEGWYLARWASLFTSPLPASLLTQESDSDQPSGSAPVPIHVLQPTRAGEISVNDLSVTMSNNARNGDDTVKRNEPDVLSSSAVATLDAGDAFSRSVSTTNVDLAVNRDKHAEKDSSLLESTCSSSRRNVAEEDAASSDALQHGPRQQPDTVSVSSAGINGAHQGSSPPLPASSRAVATILRSPLSPELGANVHTSITATVGKLREEETHAAATAKDILTLLDTSLTIVAAWQNSVPGSAMNKAGDSDISFACVMRAWVDLKHAVNFEECRNAFPWVIDCDEMNSYNSNTNHFGSDGGAKHQLPLQQGSPTGHINYVSLSMCDGNANSYATLIGDVNRADTQVFLEARVFRKNAWGRLQQRLILESQTPVAGAVAGINSPTQRR